MRSQNAGLKAFERGFIKGAEIVSLLEIHVWLKHSMAFNQQDQ